MKATKRPRILRTSAAALLALAITSPLPVKATSLLWTPPAGSNSNWETATNWTPNTTPFTDVNDSDLHFGAAGNAFLIPINNNANLANPTDLQSITFDAGAGSYKLTGYPVVMDGGGGITNNSTSLQTISFANVPGFGGIQLNQFNFNSSTNIPLINWTAAAGDLKITNDVSFATPLTLDLGGAHNITLSGNLFQVSAGTVGTLQKDGAGTLFLNGNNSYTGATIIMAGTVKAGSTSAFGINSAVTLSSPGATLDLNGFSNSIGSLTGAAGTVTNSVASGGVTLTVGGDNTSPAAFAGTITDNPNGALTLTKVGTGTLALSGANSYHGNTNVQAGILNLQNSLALGNSPLTTVSGGATLQLQGGITIPAGQALMLSGTGAAGQTGALVNVSGTNTWSGPITLTGATTISSDSGTLTLSGTGIAGGGNALTLAGAGNGVVNTAISAITSLTKNGTGTWQLAQVANITGPTTINQGTLQLGINNALPGSTALTVNSTAGLVGTLDLNGFNQTVASLTINAPNAAPFNAVQGAGTLTLNGDINFVNNTTFAGHAFGTTIAAGTLALSAGNHNFNVAGQSGATAGSELTITSAITGAGASVTINATPSSLDNTPAGVVFSGASVNTYTGTTTVNDGTLTLNGGALVTKIAGNLVIGDGLGDVNGLANTAVVKLDFAQEIAATSNVTINADGLLNMNSSAENFTNMVINSGNVTNVPTAAGTGLVLLGTLNMTGGSISGGNGAGVAGLVLANFGSDVTATSDAGGNAATINSNVTLSNVGPLTRNFTVNRGPGAVDLDITGVVQDGLGASPSGINKLGTGVMELDGLNTYHGQTTVSAGILIVTKSTSGTFSALGFGDNTLATGTIVNSGATLELTSGTNITNEFLQLQSGARLALASGTASWTGTIQGVGGPITIDANGGNLTVGSIDKTGVDLIFTDSQKSAPGVSSITVTGPITGNSGAYNSDMLVTGVTTNLDGANTYLGPTTITSTNVGGGNGILNTGVASALPTLFGRTAIFIDESKLLVATGTGGSVLNIGGTVLNPAGANQSIASLSGLAGSKVTLGNNSLTIGFGTGLDTNGQASANFAGVISGGAGTGGITKDETSTQILSGINTYTGATMVAGGTLQAGSNQAFGINSAVTVGTVVGTPATLALNGFSETIGTLAGNTNGLVTNGAGAGANSVLTLGSATLAATTTNFNGAIIDGGAGTMGITKIGADTQRFTGFNSYTGATMVSAGILQAGSTQPFGINSAVTVNGAGTLDLNNSTFTIGNLSGAGTVTNSTGAGVLTINTEAKNAAGVLVATQTQFTGVIKETGGTLGIVINDGFGAGTGVQSFSNNGNTYSGGTTVNAGATLDIDTGAAGGLNSGALGVGTAANVLTINAGANIGTSLAAGGSSVSNAVTVNGSFNVTNVTPLLGGAPVINTFTPFAPGSLVSAGVTFRGPVSLASNGVVTITTKSGALLLVGAIGNAAGFTPAGLTFAGHTYSYIFGANTYSGLTTVGDLLGGPSGTNYVALIAAAGTTAIPGNLAITPNGYVQFVAGGLPGGTSNQIATFANVQDNGTLDTSGLNQTINALTGSGVVRLDTASWNASSGAPVPAAAGVLTVNSGLFSGNITGVGGQLVKNSSGILILTGANGYTGNTRINGGILQVDGSTASANTFVNPGTQLQGNGTVGFNVFNNGTVKPGDASGSPGTLTFRGGYSQTGSGNLRIELASATNYGRLAVGGVANLNGTLTAVSVGGFTPRPGNTFTIITAAGGVNGTFGTFNNQTGAPTGGLLKLSVVYDPNDVKLVFNQQSFVSTLNAIRGVNGIHGLTFNENAVARNLDNNLNNPRLAKVISYLDNLPIKSVFNALDEIAPDEVASIYNTQVSLANVQSINLIRRMDDIHAGSSGFSAQGFHMAGSGPNYSGTMSVGSDDGKDVKETKAVMPEEPKLGVFITGDGEWVSIGDDGNARGYDLTSGGFTLGVDYKVTPTFAIGLDAGYAHTNGDLNNGGRLDVDGGKIGLYATLFPGDFYLDTAVNGGYNAYSIKRAALGGSAFGDTDGGDLNVLVGAGYMFHAGGFTVGPTGTFQYTYMGLNGFTEHGSVAPLDLPGQNEDSIRTAFGGKASYDWKAGGIVIRPELSLAWQHEFADTAYNIDSGFANAGAGNFTVRGPNIGRDSLLLGAGVAVQLSDRFSTYVYYDGQFARTNYSDSTVSGGARVSF